LTPKRPLLWCPLYPCGNLPHPLHRDSGTFDREEGLYKNPVVPLSRIFRKALTSYRELLSEVVTFKINIAGISNTCKIVCPTSIALDYSAKLDITLKIL
jgi:hypothetical protein